jgi:hypothetical protein
MNSLNLHPKTRLNPATASARSFTRLRAAKLQRKCACGGVPGSSSECEECRKKRLPSQRPVRYPELGTQIGIPIPQDRDAALGVSWNFSKIPAVARARETPPQSLSLASAKTAAGEAPRIVHDVLRTPGQQLDATTRAEMEPHFGHDFSEVRVHSSADAALSAEALNANAYTVGSHIVFGSGRFALATQDGRRLLAHELAHVVQQEGSMAQGKLILGHPGDRSEQEADAMAKHVASAPVGPQHGQQACGRVEKKVANALLTTLQRQEAPDQMPASQPASNGQLSVADPGMLKQCLAACAEGGAALIAFCNSLPDPRLRAGCFALQFVGEVACNGWCYWQYGD